MKLGHTIMMYIFAHVAGLNVSISSPSLGQSFAEGHIKRWEAGPQMGGANFPGMRIDNKPSDTLSDLCRPIHHTN